MFIYKKFRHLKHSSHLLQLIVNGPFGLHGEHAVRHVDLVAPKKGHEQSKFMPAMEASPASVNLHILDHVTQKQNVQVRL